MIAASMEDIVAKCRSRGAPAPHTLVLLGDNTVKELKNRFVFGYLCSLLKAMKLQQHSRKPDMYIQYMYFEVCMVADC